MPRAKTESPGRERLHVSLVAIPEVTMSSLTGLYDVFKMFAILGTFDPAVPRESPFEVEIVSPEPGALITASGLPIAAQRQLREVRRTHIIIVPSILVESARLEMRALPRGGRVVEASPCARRHAVFGLFRSALDRRDRPARRPGCDDALGLRARPFSAIFPRCICGWKRC